MNLALYIFLASLVAITIVLFVVSKCASTYTRKITKNAADEEEKEILMKEIKEGTKVDTEEKIDLANEFSEKKENAFMSAARKVTKGIECICGIEKEEEEEEGECDPNKEKTELGMVKVMHPLDLWKFEGDRTEKLELRPFIPIGIFRAEIVLNYLVRKIVGTVKVIEIKESNVILPVMIRFEIKLLPSPLKFKTRWDQLSLDAPIRLFRLEPLPSGNDYSINIQMYGHGKDKNIVCFYGQCFVPLCRIKGVNVSSNAKLERWLLPK